MGDALNLLRERYEQALTKYETVCSALNHHMLEVTSPTAAQLRRESEARAALDAARRAYFEAWQSSSVPDLR